MKRDALKLVQATRPAFWAYTGGAYVVGALFGAILLESHNASFNFSLPLLLFFLWFLVGENVFGLLMNDYFDRENDRLNPRKVAAGALFQDRLFVHYWCAIWISLAAFALLIIWSGSVMLLSYGAVLVAFNILYNVPPMRLKGRSPFDLLVGPASFIPPLLAGYSIVTGAWPTPWALAALFCWFAAFELFDKILDASADAVGGVRTTAVALGARRSIFLCAGLFVASAALVAAFAPGLLALAALLPAALPLSLLHRDEASYPDMFRTLPLWYVAFGFVVTSWLMFEYFH